MSQEQIVNAICAFDDDAAVKVITDTLTLRPEVAPVVVKNACPDLAFAPASAFTARRSAGYVKQAADSSGFGLIENPELKLIFGVDVSAHRDQLGSLESGAAVNFAVLLTDDEKPQAFDILPGHEGASKPGAVTASHMAAAQLLQGLSKNQALQLPAPPPNNGWNQGGQPPPPNGLPPPNGFGDNWNQGWNQGGAPAPAPPVPAPPFGGKDGWNQGGGKDSFGKGGWNDGKGGYDCKGGFGGGKDGFGCGGMDQNKGGFGGMDQSKGGWMDPSKGGWSPSPPDFSKGGCYGDGMEGGKGKKW